MTKTVLDEIKHALMAANAVQGEQEFCVAWLGKNASYMRVLHPTITAKCRCVGGVCK